MSATPQFGQCRWRTVGAQVVQRRAQPLGEAAALCAFHSAPTVVAEFRLAADRQYLAQGGDVAERSLRGRHYDAQRERPWCKRTRKVADELASRITFFRVATPQELSRCTSTNLPRSTRVARASISTVATSSAGSSTNTGPPPSMRTHAGWSRCWGCRSRQAPPAGQYASPAAPRTGQR